MEKYDVEFEKQLVKIGYKKQWFYDKSAYWFSKPTNNCPVKGLKCISNIETDTRKWFIIVEAMKGPTDSVEVKLPYSKSKILKHKI